tara:strand:+ start:430 stop:1137 length:708 start_codon:yes stop_codon:yes gene_type:complete
MQKFDIKTIKKYFINPSDSMQKNSKYKNRYNHMIKLLEDNKYKNTIHYRSKINNNHTVEIKKSILNILNKNINDEPILILEDDIKCFKQCAKCRDISKDDIVNIPIDCDAYYLGYHLWGMYKWSDPPVHYRSHIVSINNGEYFRFLNMLGGHSIIFKNKRFKERVIKEYTKKDDRASDVILAELMKEYNVYGIHCPKFYQCYEHNLTDKKIVCSTNINYDNMVTVMLSQVKSLIN